MNTFTLIFLLALVLGTALQLWLSSRQTRYVRQHADEVPEAFAERVSLADHQKAANYTQAKLQLEKVELVLTPIILLLWSLGGGLALLDRLWLQVELSALWQGVALIVSMLLISMLIELPLRVVKTFGIESRFGFNRSTPARFIADLGIETLVSLALGIPLLAVILWLMDSAGEYWWAYVWLVWMGFMLTMTWAYPTLIAPLFNKFEPLETGEMRERLEALLQRCGFKSDGMFVMDGSKRSAHGNAYFTGFGHNKRIVFFDTLLDGLEPDQVEAVLAHELGHFKRHHIRKMLINTALISLAGLALLGWLAQQSWFYNGLGVDRQSAALALTLFMLVSPVFMVFVQPLFSAMSRKHEFEADDFAVQQTNARALIDGLVKMYKESASTLTPDPLYSAFHHSHPPAPVRIAHLSSKLV